MNTTTLLIWRNNSMHSGVCSNENLFSRCSKMYSLCDVVMCCCAIDSLHIHKLLPKYNKYYVCKEWTIHKKAQRGTAQMQLKRSNQVLEYYQLHIIMEAIKNMFLSHIPLMSILGTWHAELRP